MSARNMRIVYRDVALRVNDSESENEPGDLIVRDVKYRTFNLFDVLNQYSETDEKESEEQQDVEEDTNDEVKRKKRRKRRRKAASLKTRQTVDHAEVKATDEIERSIREVFGDPLPGCSSQDRKKLQWIPGQSRGDMMQMQYKHLNPYNELKRICGSENVQAERNHRISRPRLGHLRKTRLVWPRYYWPPINMGGLSMSVDETVSSTGCNYQYFVYKRDPLYRQISLKFQKAYQSHNFENVVKAIYAHPYHVDTMLQLAEISILHENFEDAAEFTQRALYCLECAFHPRFNVTTGHCRLDYTKQENRALFFTLFRHMNFIDGRTCHRTSLELCKLLLSLDPDGDPLAAVLIIDFYALRAKEYEWFIEFCHLWGGTTRLTQLPNIVYSLALAHFHSGDEAWAGRLLRKAILMFPEVPILLLDKCSIQIDEKVRSHEYFKCNFSNIRTLEKLEHLYVERNFGLWEQADLLPWLRENVHAVLNRVDGKDVYIKYCEEQRIKYYRGKLPENVLSHDPLPPTDSIVIYKRPSTTTSSKQSTYNALSLFISSLVSNINEENVVVALDVTTITSKRKVPPTDVEQ